MAAGTRSWNTALKRSPAWLVVLFAAVALLIVGAARDNGPSTPEERAAAIERTLACPVCGGESVYESQAPVAVNMRNQIRAWVDEGNLSDEQIVAGLTESFGPDLRLLPEGGGINSLVWALPVAAAVAGIAGLIIVFRKWRQESVSAEPTAADRDLVAAALNRHDADD